jgi:hypothetical protein
MEVDSYRIILEGFPIFYAMNEARLLNVRSNRPMINV